MSEVIAAKSKEGFQSHSSRAAESSMDSGQESAMACRKSGAYSQTKPGMCFLISAASSPGVKLMAATLKFEWCFSREKSASMRSRMDLRQSGIYIMGKLVSSLRKQV